MGLIKVGNKPTRRRNNEAKLKNQQFLNQIISKDLKIINI